MDNKDFDNKFREELNKEMDFNFQKEDWKDIEGRIQKPKKKNRPFFFWLALGSICLGMALTGFYLLKQQTIQQLKIESLQENFTNQKNNLEKDTVFIERTVTVHDTIFKYITKGEELTNSSSAISKTQTSYTPINNNFKPTTENVYSNSRITSTYNLSKSSLLPNSTILQQSSKKLVYEISPNERLNEPINNVNLAIPKLLRLQTLENVDSKDILLQYVNNDNFKLLPIFSKNQNDSPKFKPHFLIGPSYSYSQPENYSTVTDSISRNAHSAGIKINFAVNKRLSITSQVAHEWLNYTMPKGGFFTGTDSLPGLAQVPISSAFVKQKRWQYIIGGNYKVFTKNKTSVYVSAQVEAQSNLNQLVSRSYELAYFQDTITETTLNKSFRINSIIPGIGFNYQINDHCILQLEPWLRINLSENKNQMYQRFGISTALLFR